MRRIWLGSLSVALGLWATEAPAQDGVWRPAAGQPAPGQVIAATPSLPPAVTLGQPVAVARPAVAPAPAPRPAPITDPQVRAAGYSPPIASGGPIVRGQAPDAGPPPVPPPGVPLVPGAADPLTAPVIGPPLPPPDPMLGGCPPPPPVVGGPCPPCPRAFLQSDHCFDGFASPVTNPFYFEDPRALTELRPIFIYQNVPSHNLLMHNGQIEFFGTQARVALTDRWSIVMQELGGIFVQPGAGSPIGNESNFAQIDIGPKYTFLRNDCTQTLGAVGLTFEIPTGSGVNGFGQGEGTLAMRPYLSLAQAFGKSSYGTFNAMGTLGADLSIDNKRSDFFFTSLHLDYDVLNAHKFYPLVELNWFHYLDNGRSNPFPFEGLDLANLGATQIAGKNTVTAALGARYKFREWAQVGTAFEVPIGGQRDLMDFRWTVDLIFRY
jgi:hypothetical protein